MSQVINGVGARAVCLPCYPLGISLRPTTLLSTVTQAPVRHISLSRPSYSYHYVEAPDIYQIYDKLPEKGGFKELFEQRFSNALVFMKHWVSYPGFFSMQSPQLRQPVEGHTQESKCWNGAKTGELGGRKEVFILTIFFLSVSYFPIPILSLCTGVESTTSMLDQLASSPPLRHIPSPEVVPVASRQKQELGQRK